MMMHSNYFAVWEGVPTLIRINKNINMNTSDRLLVGRNEGERNTVPFTTFDGRYTHLQYFDATKTSTLCVAYSWAPYGEGQVAVLYGATILPKHEGRPMARLIAEGRRTKAPQFAVVEAPDWVDDRSTILRRLPTRYGCRGTRLRLPHEPPPLGCMACGAVSHGGWDANLCHWVGPNCVCE